MSSTSVRSRKLTEIMDGQHQKLRSKFRKVITGDEKKRVRDHVQEQPDYVKLFDKIAFTLGLLNILACEYFLVKLPTYFWLWYSLVIPLLIITRISYFRSLGWQYFLLDFCYFVNFCVFINLSFFSTSEVFFRVCFIYANGPLTWAIVIWRNSLVFHDYDKITSVYIHFLPSLLYYAGRWHGHGSVMDLKNRFSGDYSTMSCKLPEASISSDKSLRLTDFLLAAAGYIFWQICYFIKTEVFDKQKLDSRPDLLTSLRWMSTDKKNFFAKFVLKRCRNLGLLRSDEHFDCYSVKTKMIFMGAQLLYSVGTFLPTVLLYNSEMLHVGFLIFIFCAAAFNGASFYIEVFSKAYQLKIDKLLERKRVADSALIISVDTVKASTIADGKYAASGANSEFEQLTPNSDYRQAVEIYEEDYTDNYSDDSIEEEKYARDIISKYQNGYDEVKSSEVRPQNGSTYNNGNGISSSSENGNAIIANCVEIFDRDIVKDIQLKLSEHNAAVSDDDVDSSPTPSY